MAGWLTGPVRPPPVGGLRLARRIAVLLARPEPQPGR